MNVTVFGTTGAIGQLVVADLLAAGHTVAAYVRNPAKVPASWPPHLRLIVGEITNAAAIDDAVAGADAVISALRPSLNRKASGLPLVEGTRHIVDAMKRHGVRRFIGNGTPIHSRETVDGSRPSWRAISRTPMPCAFDKAMSSRSLNDRYRPDTVTGNPGFTPPACRNHRNPTGGDTPAAVAASSVITPDLIAAQNLTRSSRHATVRRPGEGS
jgi:putative NAD(P)-binding protein